MSCPAEIRRHSGVSQSTTEGTYSCSRKNSPSTRAGEAKFVMCVDYGFEGNRVKNRAIGLTCKRLVRLAKVRGIAGVAEDEALIRMDLVEMLAEEGYEVVGQAATGEAAVALVERLRPDVVLLDVRMPVMDGISAAEVITSRHACAIVMLTAFSERELVERAAVAGAAAYLVKPVSAVHLIPAIEVARARQSEAAALSAEVETLELRLAARKVIERAKGVLMRDFGLDEAGAFAWLRREAMDRRMSMADVAEVVTRDVRP